jgi:hypothetical protein
MSATGTSAGPGKGTTAVMDRRTVAPYRPRVKPTGTGALAMMPKEAAR